MLPNSVTLTDSASDTCDLTKRSEQGGISKFTGSYTNSGGYTRDIVLEVKHTRGDPGKKGSSLLKLTMHQYDPDGVFTDTRKAWTVMESTGLNAARAEDAFAAMSSALAVTAFADEFYGGSY